MEYIRISKQRKHESILILYVISALNIILFPFVKKWTSFIDEFVILFLCFEGYKHIHLKKCKELLVALCVLGIYLIYSLIFGQNVYQAVLLDFILFLKPIFAFFVPFYLSFRITQQQRKTLRIVFFVLGMICIAQLPFIDSIYINTSGYYTCCTVCAISYIIFSDFSRKDIIIMLLILTPGLFSVRAKFFTEYVFILFVLLFLKSRIHINIKWIIIFTTIAIISIYISMEKFMLYFVIGVDEEAGRTLFYYHILDVIKDFFPFGSGLGTYNTEGAAQFYSPLYSKYDMDFIYGLRDIDYKSSHDYLHDTFYPALSQFGIMGFILYIWFWIRRWKSFLQLRMEAYKICIILFFIIAIQNLADNAFTSATGVVYFMVLGMILSSNCNNNNRPVIL